MGLNYSLPHLPERTKKTRDFGLNMVMDKGLSIASVEDLISTSSDYIDLLKLGFGTSYVTQNLKEKIKAYKDANAKVYFGGTLFEAFYIRGQFEEFRKLVDDFELNCAEVSDGCIEIPHEEKLKCIEILSKQTTVVSEVGSKEAGKHISSDRWISMMNEELNAGAWKVIAEARESGNVGIYDSKGGADKDLIGTILDNVPKNDIIWETPAKSQQVWFIKLLGSNVNLGNIAPNDIIPLETLRLGLRGDTFFDFLPEELKK